MMQKSVPTWEAHIYVGFLNNDKLDDYVAEVGQWKRQNDFDRARQTAKLLCNDYCTAVGLCVTFTETEFLYKNGNEPGCIVGLISYPRFPEPIENLRNKALELGDLLRRALSQKKVSIVFSDETIMLYEGEL
jgi:hypothetical protein